MKTILEVLNLSADFLAKHQIDNAKKEALDLIGDALSLNRTEVYLKHDFPIVEHELEKIRERLKRRIKGEPLAYIHGSVQFSNCKIHVSPDVLIPRQETEILVDMIGKTLDPEGKVLLDLCCGSGYIGIALKKKFPALDVILSDISPKALQIAEKNALENVVNVQFNLGDLVENLKAKVDYVVCNPPYISQAEYDELDPEVLHFEPKVALLAGPSGLEFYHRLAHLLPTVLHPKGKVWFEIGAKQGPSVLALFNHPSWVKKSLQKDWAGHDRFISLEIE